MGFGARERRFGVRHQPLGCLCDALVATFCNFDLATRFLDWSSSNALRIGSGWLASCRRVAHTRIRARTLHIRRTSASIGHTCTVANRRSLTDHSLKAAEPHSADCHGTLAVTSRHARIAMRH